ncbi:MAG: hypothetical protein V1740_00885 [Candidatus Woesearchaeota archaeon]
MNNINLLNPMEYLTNAWDTAKALARDFVIGTSIVAVAASCATQNYGVDHTTKSRRVPENFPEVREKAPEPAQAECEDVFDPADLDSILQTEMAQRAKKQGQISALINGTGIDPNPGLKDHIPSDGTSYVVPVDVNLITSRKSSIPGNSELLRFGENYLNGIGSTQEGVFNITQFARHFLPQGEMQVSGLYVSDPDITGGFKDFLIFYSRFNPDGEINKVFPQVYARTTNFYDKRIRANDIPEISFVFCNNGPDLEHETVYVRNLLEKFMGAGLAAYRTSASLGQPEVGAGGYVAKELTKGLLNLFRDRRDDVNFVYEVDLGQNIGSLTNEQIFWRAFGSDNAANANYLVPFVDSNGNDILLLCRSNRSELTEDPLVLNVASYRQGGLFGFSLFAPGVKGPNKLIDYGIDIASQGVGAAAEKALYTPPEPEQQIYIIPIMVPNGSNSLIPWCPQLPPSPGGIPQLGGTGSFFNAFGPTGNGGVLSGGGFTGGGALNPGP